MVSNKAKGRASISLVRKTKEELDAIKHTGQSYDGLIQELIKSWKREHGVKEGAETR